ncbi:MAG: UDP-3-O-acyl-N-acetylglucosamine deacetylase [Parvibaculales bacterium]
MAPPPATLGQMHDRFQTVPSKGKAPCGIMQKTIAAAFECSGVGLHSGAEVSFTLNPAPANTGIVFIRTDVENTSEATIPALFAHVCQVTLCSVIGNSYGHTVGTVEHLMAALSGMGVDNAVIKIDGPEVPVMDGSSQAFVDLIQSVGTVELDEPRRMIRIKRSVTVQEDDKSCTLMPDVGCVFEADIEFSNAVIGKQSATFDLSGSDFSDYVSNARTFGMLHEVQAMHAAGLALGGSLENAVVIDGEKVLNEDGLRGEDEFVRHKILDAVGDLYLAGLRIIGRYKGVKSGHALHNKLLHALFSRPDAFEIVSLAEEPELATLAAAE